MHASPKVLVVGGMLGVAALLAGCGGGSKPATTTTTSSPGSAAKPSTSFSTANVSGVGTAVVDGSGRTVYILTADGHTNVPCTAASGCTKLWHNLPLPNGTSAAKGGMGITASLLGTKTLSGMTFPTYHGWLMYEYTGDSGPGQSNGQGIKSFGGTWYALKASGSPVTSGGGGGGGYP
jgi:predicted lipoprotein with Yx(FWY)xxD motif